jgi:CheY-like chemotaxis protein/KaiC/GvpD/RAD55 family RecA-like ATPase
VRPTGASIIDHVLGGYPPGLPLVVAGPSGCGRTVLSLQLAQGALGRGEVVLIVSSEPAQSLMHQADALGFELDGALAEDRLVLLELDASTPSLVRAQGVDPLVAALRAEAPELSLVIVDPFTAITAEVVDEPRLRELTRSFVRALGAETLVLTVESERLAQQRGLDRVLSELCGAYLLLEREGNGRRTLTVEKSRSGIGAAERVEFAIGPHGTHLVDDAKPKAEIAMFTRVRRVPERRATPPVRHQSPDADLAEPLVPIGPPPPRRHDVPRSMPLADAVQPVQLAHPPAPAATRTQSLILLVEDSRMQRELVTEWLSPRYDVITAADGFEALAKVVTNKPDLLILDLIMPRVSGYELLCALRRAHVNVPVLVASSRVQTAGDRLGPLVLGATDFLPKPVNRLELEHKVETLLRLRRDHDPRFDGGEAEELFGRTSASRLLEAPDFRDRLTRACSFGERHGFVSSLVRVDAPDARSLDRFLDLADQELRFEDAILRVGKRRAVVLLVATGPGDAPKVVSRLLGSGDGSAGRFTVEAFAATPDESDNEALELIASAAGEKA